MNKDINLEEFVASLSSLQKLELLRIIETDYIKKELEEDYWRYGKHVDIYEGLVEELKEKHAREIYEYVDEVIQNSVNYGEILQDAVEYVIEKYNILDKKK